MTADTCTQTPKAKEAIDCLLGYVQSFMAPKLATAYVDHAPLHWKAMQKCVYHAVNENLCKLTLFRVHTRVRQHLGHDLLSWPRVDMGGPFFALTVKEAGSGVVHLDWNDNRVIYAYIFAVGDWEGGEFCIPQLGIKIPVRPGQVLAVLARVLAHFSALVTSGRRIVFTCFTDTLLFKHTHPESEGVVVL
jgi:hypothetical protein